MIKNEDHIIEFIKSNIKTTSKDVLKSIGDDCAVIRVDRLRSLVVTTDTSLLGPHFTKDYSPYEIGYKCLATNLSDIAAMDELEMLEHLKEHFDITDIKPVDIDITDYHEPPITTKGDPYLRNVVDNWYHGSVYPGKGQDQAHRDENPLKNSANRSVMMALTPKECRRQLKQAIDGDMTAASF